MKIDLELKDPDLTVGDLKLGDVFQVKATRFGHYLVVGLFTPHVTESNKKDSGTVVLSLSTNQVMKLASDLPVVLIPDAVITNKGK
ncbi:hypothetical protein [Escherichia phage 4E8]|nr:hypothetical protein [Escherichia phage 4E8]